MFWTVGNDDSPGPRGYGRSSDLDCARVCGSVKVDVLDIDREFVLDDGDADGDIVELHAS